MNILFCIPKLEIGGAEVFLVRLITALKNKGHNCCILETTEYAEKQSVLKSQLGKDIKIYNLRGPKFVYKIIDKIDKETNSNKCRIFLMRYILKKIIRKHHINVINTHVFSADYWITQSLKSSNVPITITMHGCYEDPDINIAKAKDVLNRADAIIYIADKNLNFISENNIDLNTKVFEKIYNGYIQNNKESENINRVVINCSEEDFIFVLVARGIPEKGWEVAINAFSKLNKLYPQSKLLLIGGSEYINQLKIKNTNSSIIFLGLIKNPHIYLQISNVGLLPTFYENESLPNSITEYLHNQLPVIATDVGEIKNMISADNSMAGIIIEKQSVDSLFDAMTTYITNKTIYENHKSHTNSTLKKFNMDLCTSSYLKVFNSVILSKNI